MTEITANNVPPEGIQPVPFAGALILGPILFTAPFFVAASIFNSVGINHNGLMLIAVIPVAALSLGAIPYLVFGTPAFVIALRKGGSTAGAAFLANLAGTPVIFAAIAIANSTNVAGSSVGLTLFFGSIFAPIWGAMFGWLYRQFARK